MRTAWSTTSARLRRWMKPAFWGLLASSLFLAGPHWMPRGYAYAFTVASLALTIVPFRSFIGEMAVFLAFCLVLSLLGRWVNPRIIFYAIGLPFLLLAIVLCIWIALMLLRDHRRDRQQAPGSDPPPSLDREPPHP